MKKGKGTIWFILIIAIVIVGIFLYARHKNETYGNSLTNTTTSNGALSMYTNTTYGFSVSYPNGFIATSTFASSYLLPTYWNIDAEEGTGEQVVAIEYPGSNEVLSSELRIGVSSEPAEVTTCTTFPEGIATSTHSIDGRQFIVGMQSDAAMSHFSFVKSYRTTYHGTCYALDLVSFGTNPTVYDPPRMVPFDEKTAEAALDQVAESFVFTK